jgi:hypothetical protein
MHVQAALYLPHGKLEVFVEQRNFLLIRFEKVLHRGAIVPLPVQFANVLRVKEPENVDVLAYVVCVSAQELVQLREVIGVDSWKERTICVSLKHFVVEYRLELLFGIGLEEEDGVQVLFEHVCLIAEYFQFVRQAIINGQYGEARRLTEQTLRDRQLFQDLLLPLYLHDTFDIVKHHIKEEVEMA